MSPPPRHPPRPSVPPSKLNARIIGRHRWPRYVAASHLELDPPIPADQHRRPVRDLGAEPLEVGEHVRSASIRITPSPAREPSARFTFSRVTPTIAARVD